MWTRLPAGSSDYGDPEGRNSLSCGRFTGLFERDKEQIVTCRNPDILNPDFGNIFADLSKLRNINV